MKCENCKHNNGIGKPKGWEIPARLCRFGCVAWFAKGCNKHEKK